MSILGHANEAEIRMALGRDPERRLFRNTVGEAWQGQPHRMAGQPSDVICLRNPRRVVYGLAPGSADLIAIERVLITPEMVGQTIGVFGSIEVKSGTGRARTNQSKWAAFVRAMGGRAGVAYTADEARAILLGQEP